MLRIVGLVLLSVLMAGFGSCAVLSGVFAFGSPILLLLTALMVGLTWLCWRGFRRLRRAESAGGE